MPDDMMDAARIDGLSDYKIYSKIYLPLSRTITITIGINVFVTNWNTYLWPLIVAQDESLWTIEVAMSNYSGEFATAWNLIFATSVIAALPTVFLFFVFQRYIKDGITTTGTKG